MLFHSRTKFAHSQRNIQELLWNPYDDLELFKKETKMLGIVDFLPFHPQQSGLWTVAQPDFSSLMRSLHKSLLLGYLVALPKLEAPKLYE